MDALAGLLRGIRADDALFDRSVLVPPWSVRRADGSLVTFCAVTRGAGWVVPSVGERRLMQAGDVAVVRGPEPFSFVDTGAEHEETVLVAGGYRVLGTVSRQLLDALPPVLVLPCEHEDPILDYVASEAAATGPGQAVVLDRMLDWLLVCTLRAWLDRPESDSPAWYHALNDRVTGPALQAIHENPGRSWTVAALAKHAGVSRATLAQRFRDTVGEPPLSYLTNWRMAVAADLLTGSDAPITSVARQVGYADGFGFSAAFKRTRGISPSAYRAGRA
ncbi:MAG: AraC family transcriptional regulator [Kibdelosporangium sp.]